MASRYWVGGTETWDATAGTKWALTSGGAGGQAVPTADDDVFIDAASGAVTVTTSGTTDDVCKSLNFTGFSGTFSHLASTTVTIGSSTAGAGNVCLEFSNTMIYTRGSTTTSAWSFVSTAATPQTINTTTRTLANTTFSGAGATWKAVGDLLLGASNLTTLTLVAGTIDVGTNNMTFGKFSSSGTGVRSITATSGSWTCLGTGTVWYTNTSTNFTFTPGSSTLTISSTSATAKTISNGTVALGNLRIAGDNITWQGSSTCASLAINTAGLATGLKLTSGTTKTVTGSITSNGAPGSLARISSVTAGSPATISKASGTAIFNYMSIQDITVTGGATFYAGAGSTDVSGNTGWLFSDPPATGSMLQMFM